MENEEVLGADQGNMNLPPTQEVGGSYVATDANEFKDESPYYTARPYVLNEHRRVAKMDLVIENKQVAMGLVSILLTPRDYDSIESQSSTDLRTDDFHALVMVSILNFFIYFAQLFSISYTNNCVFLSSWGPKVVGYRDEIGD